MSISLENLRDGSTSDRNFLALARLVIGTGGKDIGIRFGTGTVTWPGGSTFSSAASVTHGLGATPVVAFVGDASGGALAHIPVYVATSLGATTFSVTAETGDLSSPAAATIRNFFWVAIG